MNKNRQVTQPVDITPPACPVCDETARRDEQLIDALQSAMMALTTRDGFSWEVRSARARANLLVAMRLMQVKKW